MLTYHKIISWIPGLEKFEWLNIANEYDPFKYVSFPKNAGNQIYRLTKINKDLIRQYNNKFHNKNNQHMIYAFQSIVDSTVQTSNTIELFEKLTSKRNKHVLFDINTTMEEFFYM